jgi:AraC-like DNA-binding protein
MLLDPRCESEKISAVAYDSGFGDLSYFYRMFRRRFGAAPADIRAQSRGQPPRTLM